MSRKRSALIPALLAAATAALAGCGSTAGPAGPTGAGPLPAGPAGALKVGITDGHLGDATTDRSGGGLRRLSKGGPLEPAARRAPNVREGVGAADACPNADLMPDASNLATVADATLCMLNGERADRGLSALRLNDQLKRAALAHGADMVDHLYFSHAGRDGSQPAERIRAVGYLASGGAWRIGENLAWGTGDLATPKSIMAAWMNSPGHRANILQPDYREIGFGVIAGNPDSRDTGGATYVTEFGFVDRPLRLASTRVRSGAQRRAASRRAARAKSRRAAARRAHARAKARRARARRARVALAPHSRRGHVVGRVASMRGGLG
jgi:uncharacterized protein YkwD